MADEEGIRLAKDVLQALLKAKKTLRLYPSNNPIFTRTLEDSYGRIKAFFDGREELNLKITRNEIFYGGESVYQGTGKDENLALFLFRDGLRDVVFKRGLSEEEFLAFIEIIAYDFDREDVEEDVVTLMWQKDFQNIKYTVDENVLTEDESYERDAVAHAKEAAAEEDDLKRAYEDALLAEEKKEIVVVPISDSDLKALSEAIEGGYGEKERKLIGILFEMLEQAVTIDEYKDMVHILNSTVEYSLTNGDFDSPIAIFERLRGIMNTLPPADERRRHLSVVFWNASSPQSVKSVGALLESERKIDGAAFEKYVGFLDKNAATSFIGMLGGLKSESARRSVIGALAILGRGDVTLLARGLGDERWHVVCDIVHVLRMIGDKKAVEFLIKAMGHADIRVRKEVLRALGELGTHTAALAIKEHLSDAEPTVRITALRALGSIGSEYAKNTLLWKISEKNFIDADFNEKKEYFEVLSHWNDPIVVDFLVKLLKKSSLFNRAKHNELKACAAHCLGLIGSRDSLPELEKLRSSRDEILSEYAYAAIKRIEYGR